MLWIVRQVLIDLMPILTEQRGLGCDYVVLSTLLSVAVVDLQYAHNGCLR